MEHISNTSEFGKAAGHASTSIDARAGNTGAPEETMADRLVDSAERNFEKGAEKVRHVADEVKKTVSNVGSGICSTSSELLTEVENAAKGAYSTAVDEGRRRASQLENQIQRAPLTSLGVAFALGIACSALLRRR